MKKSPTSIAKFLTTNSRRISPLLTEAKHLAQIKIILHQALDHEQAKHVHVSRLEKNQLLLVVDSAVWATRLRFKHTEIISRFQNYAISKMIKRIEIKVRPVSTSGIVKKSKKHQIKLSSQSADLMLAEIKAISDPKLKEALLRITRRAK